MLYIMHCGKKKKQINKLVLYMHYALYAKMHVLTCALWLCGASWEDKHTPPSLPFFFYFSIFSPWTVRRFICHKPFQKHTIAYLFILCSFTVTPKNIGQTQSKNRWRFIA